MAVALLVIFRQKSTGPQMDSKNRRGRFGACITSDIAAKLNRIVIQELISAGLPVTFIPPSSIFIAKNGKPLKTFIEPILILLEKGIIPVLYGDVIWDTKRIFYFFRRDLSENSGPRADEKALANSPRYPTGK